MRKLICWRVKKEKKYGGSILIEELSPTDFIEYCENHLSKIAFYFGCF